MCGHRRRALGGLRFLGNPKRSEVIGRRFSSLAHASGYHAYGEIDRFEKITASPGSRRDQASAPNSQRIPAIHSGSSRFRVSGKVSTTAMPTRNNSDNHITAVVMAIPSCAFNEPE